ncbi:MAG: hypothetical protein ACXVXP_10210 [Mycobacteriaceae bacterium]
MTKLSPGTESERNFRKQLTINGLATLALVAGSVSRRGKAPWQIHVTGLLFTLVTAGLIAAAVGSDFVAMRRRGAKLSVAVAVFDAVLVVASALFMFLLFVGGYLAVPALVLICLVHGLTVARQRFLNGDTSSILLLAVLMAALSTTCAGHPWAPRSPLWTATAVGTGTLAIVAVAAFANELRHRSR